MDSDLGKGLALLRSEGLAAESHAGPPAEIVGGTEAFVFSGVLMFKNGFNISFEREGWVVRLPGEGQLVDEAVVPDIASAVARVVAALRTLRSSS